MARSSRIYVVTSINGDPYAGFTVKHELVTWLKRDFEKYPTRPPVRIFSMRDGGSWGARGDNDLKILFEKELLDDQ